MYWGEIAQLAEHQMKKLLVLARRNTDAGLTPDAARNMSPRVNCQCRLTYGVHTAHMCNCTHRLYMRMLNIPNHTHTQYTWQCTHVVYKTHTHQSFSHPYFHVLTISCIAGETPRPAGVQTQRWRSSWHSGSLGWLQTHKSCCTQKNLHAAETNGNIIINKNMKQNDC